MINLSEDKSFFRGSFYAGLRYAGIEDDCSWIPISPTLGEVRSLIGKYPQLVYHWESSVYLGNSPCLVMYETDTMNDNGLLEGHATFLSDSALFTGCNEDKHKFNVLAIISGWENLKPTGIVRIAWNRVKDRLKAIKRRINNLYTY